VGATGTPQRKFAHYYDFVSISPDSKYVIRLAAVAKIPAEWDTYAPATNFESWRILHDDPRAVSPTNYYRPEQYELTDLKTGQSLPLVDAPFGDTVGYFEPSSAVWAQDGKRVLLTNTFLPIETSGFSERAERLRPCSVTEVELPSRVANCIAYSRDGHVATSEGTPPLHLTGVQFGSSNDEVLAEFTVPQSNVSRTERYEYHGGRWETLDSPDVERERGVLKAGASGIDDSLTVRVRQSLNDPPALWATDPTTGKSMEIWNPNPQLTQMTFGRAEVYRWKDQSGHEWTGGLVLPVGYETGRRYPLVIQTHGFSSTEFLTDGAFTTAMAARPLASAGIMVLQVQTNYSHQMKDQEQADNVLGYESAIDQLVKEGLVDRSRVGIVGFSRTSWYVESALVKDTNRYAAASISDGVDQSYMQAMLADPGRSNSEGQTMYGASEFGDGINRWVQLAPGFHLDRVRTPLIITAITRPSVLYEWELYSALYQQNKPVDFICITDGQHILQKPKDRLASQQGNVDWFRFWLQDYERAGPEDFDQYNRWEHLRELQDADRKNSQVMTEAKPN